MFLPNVPEATFIPDATFIPGATFILGATSIPDSRVCVTFVTRLLISSI